MARIALVTKDAVLPAEKPVYDAFVAARGSEPNIGPYSIIAHIPEIALRLDALRQYIRKEASLPQGVQELVMLTVARDMNCGFIWYAHAAAAREAGVRGEIVDSVRDKRPLVGLTPPEQVAVNFARELLQNRKVGKSTFDAATKEFGQRGTLTLTNLVACYAVLAYNMNTYELEAPAHPTEPALPT